MKIGIAFLALLLAISSAVAQIPEPNIMQTVEKMTKAREQNDQLKLQYSWTQRSEIKKDGESKSVEMAVMRYTVDGKLQRTLLTDETGKKKRGIRGRRAKKKMKKMKEWADEVMALLQQYSLPSSGKLLDYLNQATITPDEAQGTIKIAAVNVVQKGDALIMWVDLETKALLKTQVKTALDGDAVNMDTSHDRAEGGLGFLARAIVSSPEKELELIVENFKYLKE
jgi:hypothetical protein